MHGQTPMGGGVNEPPEGENLYFLGRLEGIFAKMTCMGTGRPRGESERVGREMEIIYIFGVGGMVFAKNA